MCVDPFFSLSSFPFYFTLICCTGMQVLQALIYFCSYTLCFELYTQDKIKKKATVLIINSVQALSCVNTSTSGMFQWKSTAVAYPHADIIWPHHMATVKLIKRPSWASRLRPTRTVGVSSPSSRQLRNQLVHGVCQFCWNSTGKLK